MDFPDYAAEIFDKLISFYSEKFKIEYNVEIAGEIVPVMADMHDRQQKSVMGFPVKGLGPQAGEYIVFLSKDCFNSDVMESIKEIFSALEKEYVYPSRDHAFTFLSAVVIADSVEKDSVNALKRYKLRRDYGGNGWLLSRIVVFCRDGTGYSNKDGSDLKRMLQRVM